AGEVPLATQHPATAHNWVPVSRRRCHSAMIATEVRDPVVLTPLARLAAILAVVLATVIGGGAGAQTPPASPPPLPQDQFDALVKAITQSVLEKLKAEGTAAPKPAEEKHSRFDVTTAPTPDD